ncbi:uncharacterized protein BDW47DRAFT_108015 [Aspergillus candidus]|uniref:Uncharacterized protein n=1 Tax=Aspergillus candidus TaxID=41067 RepID=A0A2I2F7Y4_ASPCN|nr:hypothetical protein BDW47DRAFT_108015 [Aspergillus candidus]PLB36736.1 hypothetical protein BDW47DRAFT_108015 [Aspergillus candidus]
MWLRTWPQGIELRQSIACLKQCTHMWIMDMVQVTSEPARALTPPTIATLTSAFFAHLLTVLTYETRSPAHKATHPGSVQQPTLHGPQEKTQRNPPRQSAHAWCDKRLAGLLLCPSCTGVPVDTGSLFSWAC